ncbi:permease [Enterococcus florum]|uniref:Permease n=1 Tax=Enterococcus florum TaxID=2480627 RepID=A0A4P5PAG5_9ENTE|nr:DMT family transporter [Enterococcus florum]GCF94950.1 permease [Enterococcus florum]
MKIKGVFFAIFAASMWAISGIMSEMLFTRYLVSPEWLVSTRLLISGILLTLLTVVSEKEKLSRLVRSSDVVSLLLFSIVGMLGVQYTYFKAIQYSGAAIATILQFTGPIFIFLYLVSQKEKSANLAEFFLLILTFSGIFFIVTQGNLQKLEISGLGFLMGIASAITLAFYTLQPRKLLVSYGEVPIVGLGMLIAGLVFQLIHPVWRPNFDGDFFSACLVAAIVFFGTALAFLFYLSSLRFIEASLASVLTAFEPILATILSILLFHHTFGKIQLMGFVAVIASVIVLTRLSNKPNP